MYRIKPVGGFFIAKVIDQSKEIVTIEENSIVGGIGTIISEIIADNRKNVQIKRFAIQDKQFVCYGSREWFHSVNGLNIDAILKNFLNKKEISRVN